MYIYIYIMYRLVGEEARCGCGAGRARAPGLRAQALDGLGSQDVHRAHVLRPTKSEPPSPAGAPDSQFRKIQDELNHVRNASFLNLWGWGRGFLFHRWRPPACRGRDNLLHHSPRLKTTCVRQVALDKWLPLSPLSKTLCDPSSASSPSSADPICPFPSPPACGGRPRGPSRRRARGAAAGGPAAVRLVEIYSSLNMSICF